MGGGLPRAVKFPPGIADRIDKEYEFLIETEWMWNHWKPVKFLAGGYFVAPTADCQHEGVCRWSAYAGSIYVIWGNAGLHTLRASSTPMIGDDDALVSVVLRGSRKADGSVCEATFLRVFDNKFRDDRFDPYQALEVSSDADDSTISKSFRMLSVKYHPDKAGDGVQSRKKFADVRKAKDILGEPIRRRLYDSGGMQAIRQFDSGQMPVAEPVRIERSVTLQMMFTGGSFDAEYSRNVVCARCEVPDASGKTTTKSKNPECKNCTRCAAEMQMVNRQVGPGFFMQQQQLVESKSFCKVETARLNVEIPAGAAAGHEVIFKYMGEHRSGVIPADVVVVIKHSASSTTYPGIQGPSVVGGKFTRVNGKDVQTEVRLKLSEALLGFSKKLMHLDNSLVAIGSSTVIQPFEVMKFPGLGFPSSSSDSHDTTRGDLLVTIIVEYPSTHLSPSQKNALSTAFQISS